MDLVSRAAGLAIVFTLLAIWAWVMRRAGARFTSPFRRRTAPRAVALRSEATLVLSAQHRLHLVDCEHKRFLVLPSPAGGSVLELSAHSSFQPAFTEALGTVPDQPPVAREDRS